MKTPKVNCVICNEPQEVETRPERVQLGPDDKPSYVRETSCDDCGVGDRYVQDTYTNSAGETVTDWRWDGFIPSKG